jgi:hypothetical protein
MKVPFKMNRYDVKTLPGIPGTKYLCRVISLFCSTIIPVAFLVSGCTSAVPVRYDIAHSEIRIESGSIAIIPGGINDDEELISDEIVSQLSGDSRFKTAEVKKVKKAISVFRAGVIEDDFSSPDEKPTDYLSIENRERIRILQQKLGVRNLVILWTEGWTVAETKKGYEYYVTLYSRIINEKGIVTGHPAFIEKIQFNENYNQFDLQSAKTKIVLIIARSFSDRIKGDCQADK